MGYVLRPVDKRPPETLTGEFRVYFHPDDLRSLGFQNGDYCLLRAHTGVAGVGIAWLGDTKSDRRRVKTTQFLKDSYKFNFGDRFSITKEDGPLTPITSIWVSEEKSHAVKEEDLISAEEDELSLGYSISSALC
jgi:hypothetical protein